MNSLGPSSVQPARPLPSFAQQAGAPQHRQVLGDSRPRDVEVGRDRPGAQLLVADQGEDLPSPRLGDRAGDLVDRVGNCEARVQGLI
jgi:hypothetical protein